MSYGATPLVADPGFFDQLGTALEQAIFDAVGILSEVFVALVILVIGWFIAGKIGNVVERLALRAELDSKVSKTPLGTLFGERNGAAAAAFGVLVQYYILLVAVFAALDHIGFTILTPWIESAVSYVPAFLGGLLVLIVGFYISDFAVDAVRESATAQKTGFPDVAADVAKALLYFVVVIIGLDTMGVSVGILYTFGETFVLAVGLALALAVGIAFGWGGKEYVAANIGDWSEQKAEA